MTAATGAARLVYGDSAQVLLTGRREGETATHTKPHANHWKVTTVTHAIKILNKPLKQPSSGTFIENAGTN